MNENELYQKWKNKVIDLSEEIGVDATLGHKFLFILLREIETISGIPKDKNPTLNKDQEKCKQLI